MKISPTCKYRAPLFSWYTMRKNPARRRYELVITHNNTRGYRSCICSYAATENATAGKDKIWMNARKSSPFANSATSESIAAK